MGDEKCQLIGGTFANLMQFSLGAICIAILIYKRQTEVPKREWLVWFLDVAKQALGSFIGHFVGIFASVIIAKNIHGADECLWYFITHVATSTFGTAVKLYLVHLLDQFILRNKITSKYFNFGVYGNPPSLSIFSFQLTIWLLMVIISKVVTYVLLAQMLEPLDRSMSVLFKVFDGHPDLELVVVMIIVPTIMNAATFWITDNFLKKGAKTDSSSPVKTRVRAQDSVSAKGSSSKNNSGGSKSRKVNSSRKTKKD